MPTKDDTPLRRGPTTSAELRRLLAERQGDPFLSWTDADGREQVLTLHAGLRRVTIGRGPSNDIVLGWDTEVARLHAELERLSGAWTVTDDGLSRSGTWRNGERIGGRQRLRDGDAVRVGRTVLAVRIPKPKAARPAIARGHGAAPDLTPTQRRVLEALCRPYRESEFATPATNQQIAEELFLSADAVKAHVRALATALGVDGVPPSQQRAALCTRALQLALIR